MTHVDEIVPNLYWLTVEGPISIVSVCLPSIFSLIKRGVHYGPYSLLTSKDVSEIYAGEIPRWCGTKTRTVLAKSRGDTFGITEFENSFERLNNEHGKNHIAMAFRSASNAASADDVESGSQDIRVGRDFDINSTSL